MFTSDSSKKGAGIDIVVLQYDRLYAGDKLVKYGNNQQIYFKTAQEAWSFYESLITHDYSSEQTTHLVHRVESACSYTFDSYCALLTSGATTGNKKNLTGNNIWVESLINTHGLEREAFVKWIDPDDIKLGKVATETWALLPYSYHKHALAFYLRHVPVNSSHAVSAERKALPKWQEVEGITLYIRHNPQFTKTKQRLRVGCGDGFMGIGQTGSTMIASCKGTAKTVSKDDCMKMLLVFANSSYGYFMMAIKGKQHKESATMVQLGASFKHIAIPDIDKLNKLQKESLLLIADEMIETSNVDDDLVDKVVYSCFESITIQDRHTIAAYLNSRVQTQIQGN